MAGMVSMILSVPRSLLGDISAISRRSHTMLTRSHTVQLLSCDMLGHGTFQIRINMTLLQN